MEINSCTSCGGKVEFSPTDKALKCLNCGNLYSIKYEKNNFKHPVDSNINIEELNKWANSTKAFKCKTCGAYTTLNKFDLAVKCQYCNTSSLMPMKELPGLKPEIIIPFKVTKDEAKIKFKQRVKNSHFVPNDFKKTIAKIPVGATYISSFTFECNVNAGFKGIESYTESYTDSQCNRKTVTKTRSISGSINHYFTNIVVEASDKILQNDINQILPYDFNEAVDYQDDFIKGYNIGYYNQTVENAEQVAKGIAVDELKRMLFRKYPRLDSVEVYPTYSNIKYNYALLPVYFVNFEYKKKSYMSLVNGQTGKTAGKLPKSKLQIMSVVLFILALVIIPLLVLILS